MRFISTRLRTLLNGGLVLFFCVVPVGGLEAASIQRPPGMTGWWPGDGNTADIIGGRDAVLRNGATFATSLVGRGFRLDGVDDFVEVPHDPALDVGTGDFTVDLWVNYNTTEGEQVLVEKNIENFSAPIGWTFTKLADNSVVLGFALSEPLTLPVDTWIHFAVRRDTGVCTIFMNGAQVAVGSCAGNADSSASLKFGHRGSPSDTPGSLDERGFFLNGRIDEVELFVGRALSDTEIQAIFEAGSAGKLKPDAELSEPATLLLVGAAFLGLLGYGRRQRKARSRTASGGQTQ